MSKRIYNTHKSAMYIEKLINKKINIIPLEEYLGSGVKIMHKCIICNHEWLKSPNKILSGLGCRICAGKARRITHEQYTEMLAVITDTIIAVGLYITSTTKTKHKKRFNLCLKLYQHFQKCGLK